MIKIDKDCFASRLREQRRIKGLTMSQLAKEAGISQRALSYYETGHRVPNNVDIVKRLASPLGTSATYLLGEEENFVQMMNEGKTGKEINLFKVTEQIKGIFAGGDFPERDKDALMKAITEAYFESKTKAKKDAQKNDN